MTIIVYNPIHFKALGFKYYDIGFAQWNLNLFKISSITMLHKIKGSHNYILLSN